MEVEGGAGGVIDHCIEWWLSLDRVYLDADLLCPHNTKQCNTDPHCEDRGHLRQQYYIPFTPSAMKQCSSLWMSHCKENRWDGTEGRLEYSASLSEVKTLTLCITHCGFLPCLLWRDFTSGESCSKLPIQYKIHSKKSSKCAAALRVSASFHW